LAYIVWDANNLSGFQLTRKSGPAHAGELRGAATGVYFDFRAGVARKARP